MATLLLRFAAPLQSWGLNSNFEVRRTEKEPTKSAVIGLLASALGRRRDESNEDLNQLKFGVRVDQEGSVSRDFHTARGEKSSYVTNRYYLEDAVFLVALESDDEAFLNRLKAAVEAPAFPLFLGRRSCPPSYPVVLGIRATAMQTALREEPWLVADWRQSRLPQRLRIICDDSSGKAIQRDVPLSFSPMHREFGWRRVSMQDAVSMNTGEKSTEHDPMVELE